MVASKDEAYNENAPGMSSDKPYEETGDDGKSGEASGITPEYEQKLIKTVKLNGETKEFDKATGSISSYVDGHDGFIESSETSGRSLSYSGNYYSRSASYKIRIPAESLDAFLGQVGGVLNIVSTNSNVDNVSAEYYDIVSRLETLEAEKQALTKLYEKADTIDYMLQVQQRLYDVIEEIESYTTRLKYYDSQVSYSTVYLSISEVVEYTEISGEPVTFGERMARAFTESWKDFANGCKNFAVGFVYAVPTLLVLAVIGGGIALLVIVIVRGAKKRRRGKKNDQV